MISSHKLLRPWICSIKSKKYKTSISDVSTYVETVVLMLKNYLNLSKAKHRPFKENLNSEVKNTMEICVSLRLCGTVDGNRVRNVWVSWYEFV